MIAQSVAEIVSRHVKLTVEGIDRMYLNVFVPGLQYEQGIVHFFREHRGQPLPSAALMRPMTRTFVAKLEDFVARHRIALVQFCPGQRKDAVMAEHLRHFGRDEGIVFVGKAQEKTPVFRTERRRSPTTGRPYPWIVRRSAMVNNYYIYAVDRDFGPFFLKFCSYFPFNAKLCLNGHEYAKRQLAKEGIAFEALDNGILKCADPKRLQVICENLDLGRPEEIQLIFNRRIPRTTRARFRTRVVTQEVTPSLNVYYKNTRIKQYHKENRALRTETTINNSYDFAVGKRLSNLPKLRAIGFAANRKLLEVERLSHDCILSEDTFQAVNRPVAAGRQRASGLRFADPRAHALLHALILFRQLAQGFRAADLRRHLAALSGNDPAAISQGAITYQLRRLRLHGLIERVPESFRYCVTDFGLRIALFFTRTYNRLLRPALVAALPTLGTVATPLQRAFNALTIQIDTTIRK